MRRSRTGLERFGTNENRILGMRGKMPPQNLTAACGIFGAKNVFRDSSQPVELQIDDSLVPVPAIYTAGNIQKNV
jgi:hypothetical protein